MSIAPVLLAVAAVTLAVLGLRELLGARGGIGEYGDEGRRTDGSGHGTTGRRTTGVGSRTIGSGSRGGARGGGTGLGTVVTGAPAAVRFRMIGGAAGICLGSMPAGLAPGKLGPLVLVAAGLGGFFLPDLLRARSERARHRRMIAALPDALDLLAVSVATGRGLAGSLGDLARSGRGPLVDELAEAGEDMTWGSGQGPALDAMRRRIGGPEIAAFCATLERSRRLGSPLADQLRRQSATLRQDQRRAIEEEAARAAPKIQLVIALVLVPSVLLLIVAALIANADTLLPTGI
ncbi:MAG: type II secretion system F family protein [Actinomycetota bacterium]|nr:type II secretion system F family protein [Actinomycetota bacterium]